jgi:hypothetical protein
MEDPMTKASKAWLHGLGAAAITSFSTAFGAVLAMPDTFNFTSEHGWANLARIVLVPTAISVFAYLKTSPLPGTTIPLDAGDTAQLKNVQVTDQGVTADSATIRKAE